MLRPATSDDFNPDLHNKPISLSKIQKAHRLADDAGLTDIEMAERAMAEMLATNPEPVIRAARKVFKESG